MGRHRPRKFEHEMKSDSYGEVLRLAQEMKNPNLNPFRVKLIPGNDRLALAAEDINKRYPGRMGKRSQDKQFGGETVDGAYVYPYPS